MIGIYMIENKINKKRYIGQSWDIEKRWRHEKLGECNTHLRASFKKYGVENFEFRVLVELPEDTTQQRLDDLEEAYIDILDTCRPTSGYNLRVGGGNQGRLSESTKQKIRLANIGRRHSDEAKRKIGEASKGHGYRSKRVRCIETQEIYSSARAASVAFNQADHAVSNSIQDGHACGGCHWEYV